MKEKTKQVCVQGLGFVGAAMSVAIARALDLNGKPRYRVIGIDLPNEAGQARVDDFNEGVFPYSTTDKKLTSELFAVNQQGNLTATTDASAYLSADVVVVDIPLDVSYLDDEPSFNISLFENAIRSIGRRVPSGALIVIETTVPPGTCEKIVVPAIKEELELRNLSEDSVHIAHSFERVMPGSDYLDSIINYWRVYAGNNGESADACEEFLSSIIDVKRYPLTRLASMTACETAKVMENTYRAVNIAFMDEWTKFSELIGVDLYEITAAIRMRPSHSNIRYPGLGVGGYCLTKDPAFAPASARQLHTLNTLEFPFSRLAMQTNRDMPFHTVERVQHLLGGSYVDKLVLVLGVSYRQDVGDSRFSAVETLVRVLEERGAQVIGFDPFLEYWPELNRHLPSELPTPQSVDAIIFCTPHQQFLELDLRKWLGVARPVVFDAVNVVPSAQRIACRNDGIVVESIGRGYGL